MNIEETGLPGLLVLTPQPFGDYYVPDCDGALTYAACLENMAAVAESPNYAFEQAEVGTSNKALTGLYFLDSSAPAVTPSRFSRKVCGCSETCFCADGLGASILDGNEVPSETPPQYSLKSSQNRPHAR